MDNDAEQQCGRLRRTLKPLRMGRVNARVEAAMVGCRHKQDVSLQTTLSKMTLRSLEISCRQWRTDMEVRGTDKVHFRKSLLEAERTDL